jgi:hypothetical protein
MQHLRQAATHFAGGKIAQRSRHTCTLHAAHPYSWLWKWLHPAVSCGKGHTLQVHVHTDVGGKGDALQVHTAGCGNGEIDTPCTPILLAV